MQSIYLSYLFRRTSTAGLQFALLSTPLDPYMRAHTRLAITQVTLIIQVWASPAVVLIFSCQTRYHIHSLRKGRYGTDKRRVSMASQGNVPIVHAHTLTVTKHP